MKKILVLGDYSLGTWHPLYGVDAQLKRILNEYSVEITNEYQKLTLDILFDYDFIINYIDAFDKRGSSDISSLLISYVALGGVMMVVHNGIIVKKQPELEQMYGASFNGHPRHEQIKFVHAESHPLGKTIMPFEVDEEPYMFTMSNIAKVTVVMNYEYHDELYPAVWVRVFGNGKILYILPGHNAQTFKNEGFEILIRQGALWCLNEMEFPQDSIYVED